MSKFTQTDKSGQPQIKGGHCSLGCRRSHSLSGTLEMTLCASSIAGVHLGAGTRVKGKMSKQGWWEVTGITFPTRRERPTEVEGKLCPFLWLVRADLGPTQPFHQGISQAGGTQPASPDPQHPLPDSRLTSLWGGGWRRKTDKTSDREKKKKNWIGTFIRSGPSLNHTSACQGLIVIPWQGPSLVTVCPSRGTCKTITRI